MMGGRVISGLGQLLLALGGFALVMTWMALTLKESYGLFESTGEPKSYTSLGISGVIIFAAAWIWALVTSISLMREARRARTENPKLPPPLPKVPPKID